MILLAKNLYCIRSANSMCTTKLGHTIKTPPFFCMSVSIQHLVRAKLSSPTAKAGKESISWVIILSSSDETNDVFRYGRKTQMLQLKENLIILIILHKLEDKYTQCVLLECMKFFVHILRYPWLDPWFQTAAQLTQLKLEVFCPYFKKSLTRPVKAKQPRNYHISHFMKSQLRED